MPIAIANITWKIYLINGAWDVFAALAVAYWWIETKGKSLEEIDEMIEGKKYLKSDMDVREMEKGGADVRKRGNFGERDEDVKEDVGDVDEKRSS